MHHMLERSMLDTRSLGKKGYRQILSTDPPDIKSSTFKDGQNSKTPINHTVKQRINHRVINLVIAPYILSLILRPRCNISPQHC